MVRQVRGLQLAAALALLVAGGPGSVAAQELPLVSAGVLPSPAPLEEPASVLPRLPVAWDAEGATPAPSVPPVALEAPADTPSAEGNGPVLQGDPLLDCPSAQPAGWFAALELNLVKPHVKNRLTAPVEIAGFLPDQVHLPTAELDWAGSPRFEVGYRLGQGCGELLVSYRFLATEGRTLLPEFDFFGPGFLESRLDLHVLDLDYASPEFELGPCWDMRWKVGARLASVFFDSRATGLFLGQRTSNSFFGGGPHAGLELWRQLTVPKLMLFSRLDGAVVVGRIHQAFEETALFEEGPVGGATSMRLSQAVPVFNLQAGLSWAPPHCEHFHLTFGYQFQYWWYLGRVADSRAELSENGLFFRGEWRF